MARRTSRVTGRSRCVPGRAGSSRCRRSTTASPSRSSTSARCPAAGPVTYDNRYVFAFIDRSTMSMEYRLGLTLKPDVNLDVYAEPFAASGHYYDYGELLEPGSRERLTYGTSGTIADGESRRQPGGDRRRQHDQPSQSRLQHAVVPQQRRVALGMADRLDALRGVAAGSRRHARCCGTRVSIDDAFRSLTAPGPEHLPDQDVVLDAGEVGQL